MQNRAKKPTPSIASLRGTLHRIDTSDIREEADRILWTLLIHPVGLNI